MHHDEETLLVLAVIDAIIALIYWTYATWGYQRRGSIGVALIFLAAMFIVDALVAGSGALFPSGSHPATTSPRAYLSAPASPASRKAYQAADSHMNEALRALKARLSVPAREALKKDQRLWTVRRDDIVNIDERSRFIEQRTRELENQNQGAAPSPQF